MAPIKISSKMLHSICLWNIVIGMDLYSIQVKRQRNKFSRESLLRYLESGAKIYCDAFKRWNINIYTEARLPRFAYIMKCLSVVFSLLLLFIWIFEMQKCCFLQWITYCLIRRKFSRINISRFVFYSNISRFVGRLRSKY